MEETYLVLEPRAKRMSLIGACVMFLSFTIYSFAVPVAIPSFMKHYGIVKYQALILGLYSIVTSSCVLIGGKLGGIIGRKKLFVIVNYAKALLAFLGALKPGTPGYFVLVYCLMGACDGLLGSAHNAVISDICIGAEKPRMIGIMGTINGVGMLLGITGGGIIIDNLGPFTLFWFFVIANSAIATIFAVFYKNKPSDEPESIDGTSIIFMLLTIGTLTAWCNFGGSAFGHFSAIGLGLIALFAASFYMFIRTQIKRGDEAMLPGFLFKSRHFIMSCAVALLVQPMVVFCSSTLSLYGQQGLGLSATVAGSLSLPKNLIFAVLPTLLGIILAKDKRNFGKVFNMTGIFIAIPALICCFVTPQTPIWVLYAAMLIFGIGTSGQASTLISYIQTDLKGEHAAMGGSAIQFASGFGRVFVNGLYSVCYTTRYHALVDSGLGTLSQVVGYGFRVMAIATFITGLGILLAKKKLYVEA